MARIRGTSATKGVCAKWRTPLVRALASLPNLDPLKKQKPGQTWKVFSSTPAQSWLALVKLLQLRPTPPARDVYDTLIEVSATAQRSDRTDYHRTNSRTSSHRSLTALRPSRPSVSALSAAFHLRRLISGSMASRINCTITVGSKASSSHDLRP